MNEGLRVSAVARPVHCVLSFVWDQLVTNVWHDILTSYWSSFYIPASDWLMSDMSLWDKVWSTFSHEDSPCVPETVTYVHLIRCQQEKAHLWSGFIKVCIRVPLIFPCWYKMMKKHLFIFSGILSVTKHFPSLPLFSSTNCVNTPGTAWFSLPSKSIKCEERYK